MTNSICFVDNYPEAANTVNVTETSITMDGANANWYEETFVLADMTDSTTFTLANYPVSAGSIVVFKNSGAQIQDTDYTVSGNIIALTDAIFAADTILVRYFAYDSATSSGNVVIGTVLWQASTTAPTGYALADGSTSYTIADYPALYTYCTDNTLIDSETATTFIIKDLTIGPTVGGVTLYGIIKN